MPTTRDIPFDEHTPDAPAHVRDNFDDIRPLAEVEAMWRKWARNLDMARERLKRPTQAQIIGTAAHALIVDRVEHGATIKQAHKDARNYLRFGTR